VDWTTALPPLVGTLIGGGLTITGQRLTDRHRDDAERRAAARQVAREGAQRDREAVIGLHRQVSDDVAEIRQAITATDEATNADRADMLAPLVPDVRARADRAAALIAVVPNGRVREAADNVYDAFGLWITEEVDALTNRIAGPSVDAPLEAPGKLATAVRDYLGELQTHETSAVETAR
jgi:hypothetical protein